MKQLSYLYAVALMLLVGCAQVVIPSPSTLN